METETKLRSSAEINELAGALISAQSRMKHAAKGKQNPHFKADYADLASVWNAVRKPLTDAGLAVTQLPMGDVLLTVLMHKSGQYIASETPIKSKDPSNPQAYGSGLTYARRYALASICGIAQADDDAQAATIVPDAQELCGVIQRETQTDDGQLWWELNNAYIFCHEETTKADYSRLIDQIGRKATIKGVSAGAKKAGKKVFEIAEVVRVEAIREEVTA
jgi:hypothetical protein